MKPHIELPVAELKTALTGFSKVITRSSCLPVLRSIRVRRDIAGAVTLQATDLDSTVTYQALEAQPGAGEPCDFLVPYQPLAKTAKSASAQDKIGLTREAKERVLIGSIVGRTPIEELIETSAIEDWPAATTITGEAMPVTEDFKSALREALDCVSTDSSRLVLNGACLDTAQRHAHYLVASNGRHLYAANSFCFDLKERIIIPDSKFLRWSGFMDSGPWSMAVEPGKEPEPPKGKEPKAEKEPGWVRFQSEQWTFITRLVEGEFPTGWRQVIPDPDRKKTVVQLQEESLKAMLEILPRLPGDEGANQPVTIEVRDHQLVLRARNRETDAWTIVPVSGATVASGDTIDVSVNRAYLGKALRMGLTELELGPDGLVPVVCRAKGRLLVMAPIRLETIPAAPTGQVPPPEPQSATEAAPPIAPAQTSTQNNETQERNNDTMPEDTTTAPAPRVARAGSEPESKPSGLKNALDHIEKIKAALREVVSQLNETTSLLKAAEREGRATEKEIESVRTTLRSLQKVNI